MAQSAAAPAQFAQWMCNHRQTDKFGRTYLYHSRSDSHSVALCECIIRDLVTICPLLRRHAAEGRVAYGINVGVIWPITHKKKTVDLAIGIPTEDSVINPEPGDIRRTQSLRRVLFSCEAKAVMTEHKKSEPRVYSELNDSHVIVNEGDPDAIAAGITVVNTAETFISPLRNQNSNGSPYVTKHRQPAVAASMRQHLLSLTRREDTKGKGFDAYCTVMVDCDNQTGCKLHITPPAPQPGDPDHYDTFVERIAGCYTTRFAGL